ncbi:MAG TPA: macrolide ABC transporter ATP-binding protein [Parvularcula sp.]|nr:macrolide ABC transporter ATP-binding protein [Parvularcula sp.]
MIRCSGVQKGYRLGERFVPALRGVDLLIDRAGFYGIMGASGSGKSTLLHLLAGLDVPDAGEVEVAGRRLDTLDERGLTRFRRHEIGIVFQQFNLIPTMTARENIELPGLLAGTPAPTLRARSGELLETLGMSARADHRPEALSGGEQQRVAIARALVNNPSIILADEPTGNVDPLMGEKIMKLFIELNKLGAAVVVATHDLELVRALGKKTLRLEAGRLHEDGAPPAAARGAAR